MHVRSGPITFLHRSDFTLSRIDPQLAGRFVAFRELWELNEFASASGIGVLDIRTGKMIIETPHEDVNLFSFVVKRNGSAAWIMVPNESSEKQVWKADRTNVYEREQLDAGNDIVPESLRLSSDRRSVTWENGAADRSAPLD